MRTLTNLLAAYPTLIKTTRIDARTDHMTDDKWRRTASHWHVTLTAHDAAADGKGYMMPPRGIVAVEYSMGSAHTERPKVREVLSSLISDASMRQSYTDVDDFAADMGIEKPSAAYHTWEACKEAERKLAALYGPSFSCTDIDTEGD